MNCSQLGICLREKYPTYAGYVASALICGTTSAIAGGKFANGAITGIFVFGLNEVMSPGKNSRLPEHLREKDNKGILGYDDDGVPIFDENHSQYHSYYVSTECETSVYCTEALAKQGLLRYPAPFAEGHPVYDEQKVRLPGFGGVRHEVYNEGEMIINVTEKNHRFYPGIVRRWITSDHTGVVIHTFGEGTGAFPALNNAGANGLWWKVDQNIYNYMREVNSHGGN